MQRTYGTLTRAGRGWRIEGLEPQVAMRLKQVFPRVAKWASKSFEFPDDPPHCADLHWFMQRYPLAMSPADRRALNRGRRTFERKVDERERIVRDDYVPRARAGLREGQQLRGYQAQAIDLALNRGGLLVGDVVGLGKTYTGAGMLLAPEARPGIVVMEAHLQSQWREKLEAFTDLRVHAIRGTRPYELPGADVYLFRYTQLIGWVDVLSSGRFRSVVFDEIQQLRRGTESGKGTAALAVASAVDYRLGLSATPIYNYGTEIWNILRYIEDGLLGSHDEFLREWSQDGKTIAQPEALGAYLREQHVFIRRTKADVGQQMPHVNTIPEHVPYDAQALRSVEALARELATRTTQGSFVERGRAGRELDLLMRQATGVAKARGVAAYVRMLLEEGDPVVLCGWHRDVYDTWLAELGEFNPVMYTGSETPARKDRAKQAFITGESNLLIISLRSGAGLDNIQHRCSTIVFGELDWSPKVHEQLIGRLDREGQQEQVTAIYLVTDDGSDPPMVEMLGLKASQAHGITDPSAPLEHHRPDRSRIRAIAERFLTRKEREALAERESEEQVARAG